MYANTASGTQKRSASPTPNYMFSRNLGRGKGDLPSSLWSSPHTGQKEILLPWLVHAHAHTLVLTHRRACLFLKVGSGKYRNFWRKKVLLRSGIPQLRPPYKAEQMGRIVN